MKWKVEIIGDSLSEASVQLLTDKTDLSLDSILLSFSRDEKVVCGGLSEAEAQEIADRLKRDGGITCRVLPDSDRKIEPVPMFRVLLVNYRPGYRTRLRRRLQELTRLPQEQIIHWLSRMPFALSKGVDSDTARRIKKSVMEAGGIVRIEAETPIQENLSARRRSNAVFRPRRVEEEKDASDALFRKEPPGTDACESGEPPLAAVPEGYLLEPPPLDRIDTSQGLIVMHPPAAFSPGIPSVPSSGGLSVLPPVLPRLMTNTMPNVLEFRPPPTPSDDPPPVVGSREHSPWADEPSPEKVRFHPPPSSTAPGALLPPVLAADADTDAPEGGGPDISGAGKDDNGESGGNGSLKLFLCQPAPEDEDTVAEALRDIMGVSLRESWDLLRKAPALLREYLDHTSAVLTVHELESRGVTVSLSRRRPDGCAGAAEARQGFRAWLKTNG